MRGSKKGGGAWEEEEEQRNRGWEGGRVLHEGHLGGGVEGRIFLALSARGSCSGALSLAGGADGEIGGITVI